MACEPVTEGELAVLEAIWDRGAATTREIVAAIYGQATASKMATVQKLVERLEAKGCVDRDREGRAHRFRATASREDYLRKRLEGLADRHCAGSLTPLVTTLLRSGRGFTSEEGDELRRLIDELWPPAE